MRDQEIIGLWEAYHQVHQVQEEVEQLDELSDRTVSNALNKRIANTGDASDRAYKHRNPEAMRAAETAADKERSMRSAVVKRRKRKLGEETETDLFDVILEYLVSEGYADTNEAAIKIMANMSEEWREGIVEDLRPLPKEKMRRQAERAYKKETRAASAGDEKETNRQMQRRIAMEDPRGRRTALQNKKKKRNED